MGQSPYAETSGYSAQKGFVKRDSRNNDYYLAQYVDEPYYPVLLLADQAITAIVPDYNIAQIKEKFGELRYYIDVPQDLEPARRNMAYAIASAAERVGTRLGLPTATYKEEA